jgi:Zn finger protein HypA/HybF involved in hydrogenase expression
MSVIMVYGVKQIPRRKEENMQAYCVKCRAKKEMKDPKAITMKNGKPATQGVCPTCGTKMFRIGKS